MIPNGLAPGCADAKDACPRGCQSWVSTTLAKLSARRLTSGTIESPSSTASAPPGMKSFCMSTTRRTSRSSIAIPTVMASHLGADDFGDPLSFEQHDDDQREDQRNDKIEQAEHKQRRQEIGA